VGKFCRAGQATDVTIWRMRVVCRIPKATNTHSEYVMLIALPLQQWLHERVSMLRYKYSACLVNYVRRFLSGLVNGLINREMNSPPFAKSGP